MTTLLDRLNLRPQERRLVVMAAAVLFLVLQFWLVWPHFKEWGQTKAAMGMSRIAIGVLREVRNSVTPSNTRHPTDFAGLASKSRQPSRA